MFTRMREFGERGLTMLKRLGAGRPVPFAMLNYAHAVGLCGDPQSAERLMWETMPIAERDDPQVVAQLYWHLGFYTGTNSNNLEQRKGYYEEALRRYLDLRNFWGMCHAITTLGVYAVDAGDIDEAERLFTEALDVARMIDFHTFIDVELNNLSIIAMEKNDLERARELMTEVIRLRRSQGRPEHQVFGPLGTLSEIALRDGDQEEARQKLREALSAINEWVVNDELVSWLRIAGVYFTRIGDFTRAAAALMNGEPHGARTDPLPSALRLINNAIDQCRAALSPEAFEAAAEHGRTLTKDEAVALVAEAL
jgi:tetratricopeptide (TPR) repeat protein